MGDNRERNESQQGHNETGSTAALKKKNMVTINAKKEEQQGAQTEDTARLRLMGISQAVPPPDAGDMDENHFSPRAPSSPPGPPPDSEDEIRNKLMSISYTDVDQPLPISGQPVAG